MNAPAAFIHPCRPVVAKRPPSGPGWVHELKHDGYRLQIHIRDGRVRLYTMNAADWSHRYPLIVEDAARIKGAAIIDAEVVCAGKDGVPDFDRLHGRCFDHLAVACAFDLLMLNGDDLRRKTFAERKAALRKLLKHEPNGIQYVEHIERDGDAMFEAVCKLRLEGIVSKRIRPVSLWPVKSWIKTKNPKAPAAIRVIEGGFRSEHSERANRLLRTHAGNRSLLLGFCVSVEGFYQFQEVLDDANSDDGAVGGGSASFCCGSNCAAVEYDVLCD